MSGLPQITGLEAPIHDCELNGLTLGDVVDCTIIENIEVHTGQVPQLQVMSEDLIVWTAKTGAIALLSIVPDFGDMPKGMGQYNYRIVEVDEAISKAVDGDPEELAKLVDSGVIALRIPEGEHLLTVETLDGSHTLSIVFVGEPLI